jgi:tetratricopeptide (TPR) repeat protein
MKWLWMGALLTTVAVAHGQTPDPKRLNAIWGAVGDHLNRQSDAWFDDGDFPKVVQILRMHFVLTPNDYEIATNLGWMLENIQLREEALAVYIRFRKTNPNDPDAAFPEGNYYFLKKAYAKVPPIIEPTLKRRPHANSFRILAHAYDRLKMYGDAKRVWQMYLSENPDDETAKLNLSKIEKKLAGGGNR